MSTAQTAPTGSGSIPTDAVAPDDALSTSELSATAAEISSLSTDEQADRALDTLLRLASLDFDTDDIRSLADALLAAQGADSGQVVDPIFGVTPSISCLASAPVPAMRMVGGSYRANQLKILGATTPAAVYEMIVERRRECFSCLSPGYLASRLFFVKLWFWFTLDVMNASPIRPWHAGESMFEEAKWPGGLPRYH